MKNAILRLSALLTAVCLLAGIPLAYAADGFEHAYTYTYDFWGDMRHSPNAYRTDAAHFITSSTLGLETPMSSPDSLFVQGNDIYIVDTNNNRIIQIRKEDDSYKLVRTISEFTGEITDVRMYSVGGTPTMLRTADVENEVVLVDEGAKDNTTDPVRTLSKPRDIYVSADGTMFIADSGNSRVLKLDSKGKYLASFIEPTDPTYDTDGFEPTKLVADVSGRVFCIATNVNKGLMKYETDGTFTGFIGAKPVTYSWYDLIWRLLSTKEQRAQQASFVPTEYNNIAIDEKGFFYVVTYKNFDENALLNGTEEPIRRLNSLGTNILIDNGMYPPIGDIQWYAGSAVITDKGASQITDVTVLDNGIYVALDKRHNRLFGYDQQGNMLWAFGGRGNALGYFNLPVAIEHMGHDLLVLDAQNASLTIMTPTEYGNLIYLADDLYHKGDYPESADIWQQVLDRNVNYDLAYIGLGRAAMQSEDYENACKYFKIARDDKNYSEAFREYRSDLVKDNVGWLFGGVAVILVIPAVIGRIKKIKWEVDNA